MGSGSEAERWTDGRAFYNTASRVREQRMGYAEHPFQSRPRLYPPPAAVKFFLLPCKHLFLPSFLFLFPLSLLYFLKTFLWAIPETAVREQRP